MKQLAYFEIQWHAKVMKDALMRYKLFVVFASLLLASSLDSLKYIFIFPAQHLFDEYTNLSSTLSSMIWFQGAGLIFFAIHFAMGTKQPGKRFLSSLPIPTKKIVIKELAVLFVWNGLLWLSMAFAAANAFLLADNTLDAVVILEKCFLNISLVLCLQWVLKTQRFGFFRRASRNQTRKKPSLKIHFKPFASIQIINLFTCRSRLTLQAAILFFSLIASSLLISYNTDTLRILMIVAIFSLINTIILSHLFIHLRDERLFYSSYLTALPLRRRMIVLNDLFIAVTTLTVCSLPLFLTANFFLATPSFATLSVIYFISILFLATNYYPLITFKKYGLFFALFNLPIFIWLDYFLFSPFI
jgi:hypothetical protein